MKILHVIPSVAPCRGGPSEAVLAMARSQSHLGIDASVLTTHDDGAGVLPVKLGSFQDHHGTRVWFLPRWSPGLAGLREFQYASGLGAWLEQHGAAYDCLHVHGVFSFLPTQAMRWARRVGMPYVARPLGQLHPWSLQQRALKKRLYWSLMERANLVSAHAIHCTSEAEAGHLQALLPSAPTVVIPHGVDPGPEVPASAAERQQVRQLAGQGPVVLFLSRWHAKKNIPLLLRALAELQELPWTLVLAGATEDEGLKAEVRHLCNATGLSARVVCPGHVQGALKQALLQQATVFVLPSASENFGVAVAEALVSGVPVIITPGVDLADTVRDLDGGWICEPTVASLADCLRQALGSHRWTEPSAKARLQEAARARFSWEANAQALKQVYAKAIPTP